MTETIDTEAETIEVETEVITATENEPTSVPMPDEPTLILPRLGLDEEARQGIIDLLSALLADEVMLYTLLRKYHWNVTGAHFFTLHEAFEQQYTAFEAIIDEVAERIRQYGAMAIGTLEEFKQYTRLEEQPGENPDAMQMVQDIMETHETLVRLLREDIDTADDYDDDGAEDFFTGLLQVHQKWAWMMRAMLRGMTGE